MSVIQLNSISIKNETTCGYCNGNKSTTKLWVTSGFYCYKMKPQEYQQLMDRGWRRCGVYYYRPSLDLSCCQAYALRVDTNNFKLRLTHEKVLKKIKSIKPISETQSLEQLQEQQIDITQQIKQLIQSDLDLSKLIILTKVGQHYTFKSIQYKEEEHIKYFKQIITSTLFKITKEQLQQIFQIFDEQDSTILHNILINCIKELSVYEITVFRGELNVIRNQWTFGCNFLPLFYTKVEQRFNSNYQLKPLSENKDIQLLIIKLFDNLDIKYKISNWDHQILLSSQETLQEKQFKSIILYHLQKIDNNNNESNTNIQNKINKKYEIEIKWVKAQFQQDSFEVYQKYQQAIHEKVKVSKQSYVNFLCLDPLNDQEFGCWHMKYYLNNKLIAVGVVDVLPQSISSVYFYYDPAYKKYSLGVYGVLKEIETTQQKRFQNNNYRYYYMGFYIMDYKKMAYKGEYNPCQLLCPQTYQWVSLNNQLKEKINQITKYQIGVSLINNIIINEEAEIYQDMNIDGLDIENFIQQNVKISQYNKIYTIQQLKKNYVQYFMNLFENFLGKIGKELMKEFIFAVI